MVAMVSSSCHLLSILLPLATLAVAQKGLRGSGRGLRRSGGLRSYQGRDLGLRRVADRLGVDVVVVDVTRFLPAGYSPPLKEEVKEKEEAEKEKEEASDGELNNAGKKLKSEQSVYMSLKPKVSSLELIKNEPNTHKRNEVTKLKVTDNKEAGITLTFMSSTTETSRELTSKVSPKKIAKIEPKNPEGMPVKSLNVTEEEKGLSATIVSPFPPSENPLDYKDDIKVEEALLVVNERRQREEMMKEEVACRPGPSCDLEGWMVVEGGLPWSRELAVQQGAPFIRLPCRGVLPCTHTQGSRGGGG